MATATDAGPRTRTTADWEELYVSLRPNLTRALVAAIGTYDSVEDAIQESFEKAMHSGLADVANVEGWLFTVALNSIRRSRRRARLFAPLVRTPASSKNDLDAALDRSEALQVLRGLPERDRTLLVAKYYVGLTQQEIARLTGLSRGTVSAAISRATMRLREREEGER